MGVEGVKKKSKNRLNWKKNNKKNITVKKKSIKIYKKTERFGSVLVL
jgi:hypothetical protein